jgi:3-phenylpropionate/trans-cinnamate dioxygenase ferredoxin reductase subunit
MISLRFNILLSALLFGASASLSASFWSHVWQTKPAPLATAPHYVIVGASAAGIAAAKELRKLREDIRITVIDAARELPYNTCKLPSYLAGKKDEHAITIFTCAQASAAHITLRLGTRVTSIDRAAHTITLDTNEVISYEKLFLATGTRPRGIPSVDQFGDGVYTLNSLEHAQNMKHYIERAHVKRAVVVGTGFTGLECAEALVKRGIQVTLITHRDNIAPYILDNDGCDIADVAAAHLKRAGVDICTNCQVTGYTRASNGTSVASVQLSTGESLQAQLLVVATGVKRNVELSQQAGIVADPVGILVNEFLCTSDPAIYAGGDVAIIKHRKKGGYWGSKKWSDAKKQGKIAAYNMVCREAYLMKIYEPRIIVPSTTVFGLSIAGAGVFDSRMKIEYSFDTVCATRRQVVYRDEKGIVRTLCRVGKPLPTWDACKASYITGTPLNAVA